MNIHRRSFHLSLIASTLALAQPEPSRPVRRRVALLIGNRQYSFGPLKNPLNDVQDMAAVLKRCNFEITSKTDLSLDSFTRSTDTFVSSLGEGDVALFFYAGHGIQVGGSNYMIPVDFNSSRGEAGVSRNCVGISELQQKIEKSRVLMNIIVIDACRDNPFTNSNARGLALMEAGLGTCLAFSACPGQAAFDGEGRNGLFTGHLLQELSGPPAPIDQVFKQVKERVYSASNQSQRPWLFFDTIGEFVFTQPDGPRTARALSLDTLIEKGKSEYLAGKFRDAEASFDGAYRINPDNPYICNALGAARMRINQTSSAVSLFSRAIEKKPDYATAYFNRGVLYSTVGDNERDAIQDFKWAIELEPYDPRAYDLRGNCYYSFSEFDLALADFNRALELNPSDAAAYLGRGKVSFRRRKNPEAIQDLNRSIELRNTAEAYEFRAMAYQADGKANQAAADRAKAASMRAR